jgi:hypothetical protein
MKYGFHRAAAADTAGLDAVSDHSHRALFGMSVQLIKASWQQRCVAEPA